MLSKIEVGRPQTTQINLAYATKQELEQFITSKEHFIQLFTNQGRFLLPLNQFITWIWIPLIFDGTKELLPLSKVPCLFIPPKVSELTVKTLYDQIRFDNRKNRFFPDTNRQIDKRYFFAVLAAILPDFFETVMAAVKENRRAMVPETEKVAVTSEMKELIAKNTAYFGPQKKIGQYINTGRKWTAPVRQEKPALDVTRLF